MDIKTILASVAASVTATAVAVPVMVSFVTLQATTPGTPDTGHSNISGYSLAARFGAGVSPTLARVQINETGTAQGVRAITNSGVAVYGQATAATGLAAGGYFTSSSVGGRAMVAEQLSTTGNTVGGLFYNRSTTGGVALWGKHIGTSGTTTGVYGEVASPNGLAMSARNTNLNSGVDIGGPNGALYSRGAGIKHEYTSNNAALAIPVAYGLVDSSGNVYYVGSGNWTSSKAGVGIYDITVTGISNISFQYSVVATPTNVAAQSINVESFNAGTCEVRSYNTGGALADVAFSFVIYRTSAGGFQPSGQQFGPYSGPKTNPRAYEAWRKKYVADQRAALRAVPTPVPTEDQPTSVSPLD